MKKKTLFKKRLFWDLKDVDYEKNKTTVIFRVVRYGDLEDFKNLKKVYNKRDIAYFYKKRGEELDIGEKKLLDLYYS